MQLFEMLINEDDMFHGVNAISLVENPAIMSDWVALNGDTKTIKMAEVDSEKRILMGAALIPNKPIYRNQNGEEFYIYFSEETVRKAAELFFKGHKQDNATLEHAQPLEGLHIFESWIVEDESHDKSRKYGLEAPVGSWVVSMKVNDDNIWQNYVKNDKVLGFSIEGQFANQLVDDMEQDLSSHKVDLSDAELAAKINNVKNILINYINQ